MDNETVDAKKQEVLTRFASLLLTLEAYKPNDRSKQDRYWAIAITEVEKAAAIFKTYTAGEST
jgi:hypothetical protein